jgi:hypothetical protein
LCLREGGRRKESWEKGKVTGLREERILRKESVKKDEKKEI